MDKRSFPLKVAKDIEELLSTFRYKYLENKHLINNNSNHPNLIYYTDKENEKFFFTVWGGSLVTGNETFFSVKFLPYSENSLDPLTSNSNKELIMEYFANWILILNEYNKVSFTLEDSFEKIYKDEFFEEFDIVDEDADTNPFEHDKQVFLFKYLTFIENVLEKNNDNSLEVLEIISETKELKANIQNSTKREFVHKLSKLMAKIKKKGLKFLNDVYDVAKKEAIKKMLYEGVDTISSYFLPNLP